MNAFHIRYERALKQRLYLITANINDEKCEFKVMGSTGNVYDVVISEDCETCTCPDFIGRRKYCKHIFFILSPVLGIKLKDIYKRMYNPGSIRKYLEKHDALNRFMRDDLAQRLNSMKIGPPKLVEQKFNDNCAICFEPIDKDKDELIYCKYICGNSVHKECYEKWEKIKPNECVYCRGKLKKSPRKGYINLEQYA